MGGLADARDRWWRAAVSQLRTDARALLLIGSLGRGEGDDWSDIDVVVFMDEVDRDVVVRPYVSIFGACFNALGPSRAPEEVALMARLIDRVESTIA